MSNTYVARSAPRFAVTFVAARRKKVIEKPLAAILAGKRGDRVGSNRDSSRQG